MLVYSYGTAIFISNHDLACVLNLADILPSSSHILKPVLTLCKLCVFPYLQVSPTSGDVNSATSTLVLIRTFVVKYLRILSVSKTDCRAA